MGAPDLPTEAALGAEQQAQRKLVDFLGRELGRSAPCRRIDTHAASIFLAGDRAWKLKRAVRYPYLDFSTPDRRRIALEAELELNRRTAPDLYLAVHPVVRTDRGFTIGGAGAPVDWLLEMRRFPDGALLDEIARDGALEPKLLLRLADSIHQFHDAARPAPGARGADAVRSVIAGNAESLAPFAERFGAARIEHLLEEQRRACNRHATLLDARARDGLVRHTHGDLHLANIALIEGEPIPFDCLEFSEALATTDILYDLAFLLMDLWRRDLRFEANLVFNRYIDLSADEDGVRLLPLFLSVRATVRAHVTAAAATRGARDHAGNEADAYLALAEALIAPGSAALVAIGGLSGTGKSAVARRLGGVFGVAPGARILRSDVLRKRLAGVAPEERLSETFYTPTASRAVYDLLADCARRHLASGSFVIVDAVLASADDRAGIEHHIAQARVPFVGCWLEAKVSTRRARVSARTGDASDADIRVVDAQSDRNWTAPAGWNRIAADGPLESVVAACQDCISGAIGSIRADKDKP